MTKSVTRPDPTFTWRGIEFEWSGSCYTADTPHGRWMVQRLDNDDSQWYARFGPYAGNNAASPQAALTSTWGFALIDHAQQIEYLKGLLT